MEVTFHRAIDVTRDVEQSLEDVIRAGAVRVLTAGGEQTAMQGRARIREMVKRANGRIGVMAGGGVTPTQRAGDYASDRSDRVSRGAPHLDAEPDEVPRTPRAVG